MCGSGTQLHNKNPITVLSMRCTHCGHTTRHRIHHTASAAGGKAQKQLMCDAQPCVHHNVCHVRSQPTRTPMGIVAFKKQKRQHQHSLGPRRRHDDCRRCAAVNCACSSPQQPPKQRCMHDQASCVDLSCPAGGPPTTPAKVTNKHCIGLSTTLTPTNTATALGAMSQGYA